MKNHCKTHKWSRKKINNEVVEEGGGLTAGSASAMINTSASQETLTLLTCLPRLCK